MKSLAYLIFGTALTAATWAGPLDKTMIPNDAKWLAHIDVQGLQQTVMGNFALNLMKEEMAKQNETSVSVDVDMMLAEIHSLTAYGTTFDEEPQMNSVLVVETGTKARSIIDGLIAGMEIQEGQESGITEVTDKRFPAYKIGDDLYAAFPREGLVISGKSFGQIERAFDIIEGKGVTIIDGDSELVITDEPGFFFLATVNGIDKIPNVPTQARVLQKAKGVQVALGEWDANFRTNISLTTSGAEVSSQLARIVQGMVALASFAQVGDERLVTLMDSVKVEQGDRFVSVELEYPTEELTRMITNLAADKGKKKQIPPSEDDRFNVEVNDAAGGEILRVRNVDARSDNGHLPRNATDNDPESYWGSQGKGQWIRFELESLSLVREVQVAWRHGDERKSTFSIQVSENGVDWKNLLDRRSSGTQHDLESYNIPDATTQWIRLLCFGNSSNQMNVISEVRFLGLPNQARLANE